MSIRSSSRVAAPSPVRFPLAGSSEPVRVEGVSARRIAAETGATCATAPDRSVTCWGEGSQFGLSVTIRPVEPRRVPFGVTPFDLDVGVISTCAGGMGQVGCHGSLLFGDCSDRVADLRRVPVEGVREVSIGYEDMCARGAGGTVWCWGCNGTGAAGDATRIPHPTPTRVLLP